MAQNSNFVYAHRKTPMSNAPSPNASLVVSKKKTRTTSHQLCCNRNQNYIAWRSNRASTASTRALLLHFIHNKLNCPLCRHGAKTPIDLSRGTFAQEEWVPHAMQLAIRSAMQERERQSQQDWHMLHAHAPYADVTIRVSVHALAENHEWLLSRMACVDSARGIYRMTTWGLRVLRRLHGRLCASGMTFEVFGRVQEDDPPVVLMSTERIRTFALLSQGLGQVPSHRDGTWEHHSRVVDPNGASITVQFLAQPHSPWEFREIIFQLP